MTHKSQGKAQSSWLMAHGSKRLNMINILPITENIARGAGAILREGVANMTQVHIQYKSSDVDPVTEYDRRSEAYIVQRLREAFPGHAIVGEEGGAYDIDIAAYGPRYEWRVDPLDGTVNFAHGVPIFAVSLGLLIDDVPSVGVVYNPMTDELFAAERGAGATLNGKPIRVSQIANFKQALLSTGFPYDRATSPINNYQNFIAFKREVQAVRRLGAAALDLSFVACGRFDAYWELKIQPHDIAAGMLIVREAGGMATDFVGHTDTPTLFAQRQMVSSNGLIHSDMLRVLKG
jgi:myo-inositol-1(or 4)-monophosphatase